MHGDRLTHGLWEASAPPPPPTRTLTTPLNVDVAIIGGGYTGCSAALHLAQSGASTVLLEASVIGFGAVGRNVGLVNAGMLVMPSALPAELGPLHGRACWTCWASARPSDRCRQPDAGSWGRRGAAAGQRWSGLYRVVAKSLHDAEIDAAGALLRRAAAHGDLMKRGVANR